MFNGAGDISYCQCLCCMFAVLFNISIVPCLIYEYTFLGSLWTVHQCRLFDLVIFLIFNHVTTCLASEMTFNTWGNAHFLFGLDGYNTIFRIYHFTCKYSSINKLNHLCTEFHPDVKGGVCDFCLKKLVWKQLLPLKFGREITHFTFKGSRCFGRRPAPTCPLKTPLSLSLSAFFTFLSFSSLSWLLHPSTVM